MLVQVVRDAFKAILQSKRAAAPAPKLNDAALMQSVNRRISPNDGMYQMYPDLDDYLRVGLSGIHCVDAALGKRPKKVSRILDLPCGHGRVLRFLPVRFPGATVVACDIERDGVDFCREAFGAAAAYSRPDLDNLSLGVRFDLIWCGSLATHLPADATLGVLRFFNRHLEIGGTAVWTMHGGFVVDRLRTKEDVYGMLDPAITQILGGLKTTGYGYADYEACDGYGISATTPQWMRDRLGQTGNWGELQLREKAWAGHHDVYTATRSK